MRIFTKIIVDIETGATVLAEGFDYEGALALAGKGGGSRGGGGGASSETSLTQEQARLSKLISQEATPLRQALIGSTEQRLGMTPSFTPSPVGLFGPQAPERQALEAQHKNARENIIGSTPARGSDLNRNLANLEMGRAGDIGALEANATNQALGLATDIGLGSTSTALSGLSNARAGASTIANRQAQQDTGLGTALGKAATAAIPLFKACWIAASIYGWGSAEFYLARTWIFERWQGRLADFTRRVYLRYGRRLSQFDMLCFLLKPLFDLAVRRARHD